MNGPILCVMRIPPSLDGHGGSQRAWRLVEALRETAPVHFVLISRATDLDAATVSLEPLRPLVESITSIDIPEWQPTQRSDMLVPKLSPGWVDLVRMGSQEAVRLPLAAQRRIAEALPVREVDTLFCGRLVSSVFMQGLIDRDLLKVRRRVVDFDDLMSRFRERQRAFLRPQNRMIASIDVRVIRAAEKRIAESWGAVSVCTDEDVELLRERFPTAHAVKIPNVIERPRLAPRTATGRPRVLFVGNLSFAANVHGLRLFLREAWPSIAAARPEIELQVVGLNPSPELLALREETAFDLQANVPSVEPYYAGADVVIAPILIGSGTRIKILESMAFGRPVVATSMAAEGMGLRDGEHIVLEDDMADFARAVVELCDDPARRERIADAARAYVTETYGVGVLRAGVREMLSVSAAPA